MCRLEGAFELEKKPRASSSLLAAVCESILSLRVPKVIGGLGVTGAVFLEPTVGPVRVRTADMEVGSEGSGLKALAVLAVTGDLFVNSNPFLSVSVSEKEKSEEVEQAVVVGSWKSPASANVLSWRRSFSFTYQLVS